VSSNSLVAYSGIPLTFAVVGDQHRIVAVLAQVQEGEMDSILSVGNVGVGGDNRGVRVADHESHHCETPL
jgi:hypothetical protein